MRSVARIDADGIVVIELFPGAAAIITAMRLTLRCVAPLLVTVACSDDPSTSPTDTSGTGSESSSSSQTNGEEEGPSTTLNPTTVSTTQSTTMPDDSEAGDESGSICGDGVVSGTEDCDCAMLPCTPQAFGDVTCIDIEDPAIPGRITGGVLDCNPASCRFNTTGCLFCGDGDVNGNEQCEPGDNVDATCMQLGAGAAGDLSCDNDCAIDTSACTDCVVEFDFESEDCQGFTTASLQPGAGPVSWACGEPTVYLHGPGVASPGVWGTNLSGPYNADEISALISPEIDLSVCTDAGVRMQLRHWHNFEGGKTNADGGIVQVSEDGVAWTTVTPVDGDLYDAKQQLEATHPPVDGVNGFSGNLDDGSWGTSEFDLSDYAGSSTLQVRLVFGSNDVGEAGGWYIDSIRMLGSSGGG